MAALDGWALDRYREILRARARLLRWDPRIRLRANESDVVQETLLRAVASAEPCRGTSDGERLAYLFRIQDAVAIDLRREHHAGKRDVAREQQLLDESTTHWEANLVDKAEGPDQQAAARETLIRTLEGVLRLPEDQMNAVLAILILDLSAQEVADLLDKTRSQVAGLYHRGITALREILHQLRSDRHDPGP
jgi:RNA polymerase sigma factor (sigma-70 family)